MNIKETFLGGTCNNSTWRDEGISKLDATKVTYFNPVVKDWTPECMVIEKAKRESCDYCLYVITSEMTGVYSIAEVTEDSIKRPSKTIFAFKPDNFSDAQIKSLNQVGRLVQDNGASFIQFEDIAPYLNTLASK